MNRALDTAAELGQLRIAVNCAGIGSGGRVAGKDGPYPLDQFRRVLEVNLVGTFNVLSKAAFRIGAAEPVEGERGVIVNTASIAAFEGQIGQAAYTASKAGIHGLTIQTARDLASLEIRVCTIAPGLMDTPLLAGLRDDIREQLAASVPNPHRLGKPAEYALLAAHIIENPYLNGETIRLDGAPDGTTLNGARGGRPPLPEPPQAARRLGVVETTQTAGMNPAQAPRLGLGASLLLPAPRRHPRAAGRLGAEPAPAGSAGRVRAPRRPHHREPLPERGDDPPRRRAPDGTTLNGARGRPPSGNPPAARRLGVVGYNSSSRDEPGLGAAFGSGASFRNANGKGGRPLPEPRAARRLGKSWDTTQQPG